MDKILQLFKLVYEGVIKKGELELNNFHVTIYTVQNTVRIDVKEKE